MTLGLPMETCHNFVLSFILRFCFLCCWLQLSDCQMLAALHQLAKYSQYPGALVHASRLTMHFRNCHAIEVFYTYVGGLILRVKRMYVCSRFGPALAGVMKRSESETWPEDLPSFDTVLGISGRFMHGYIL